MATVTPGIVWTSGETVTPAKLNAAASPTVVVADGEVTTPKLLDAAVTTSKLADGAVTAPKLASGAAIPAGAVMPFAMNSAPAGWLAADGSVVPNGSGAVQGVTADFSALYAAVSTTFGTAGTLPDLRGYFVRGSGTNSDGTAAGTFGTKQEDMFKSHTHTTSSLSNTSTPGGIYTVRQVTGSTSSGATGGIETRPKNIAMLYCIKF